MRNGWWVKLFSLFLCSVVVAVAADPANAGTQQRIDYTYNTGSFSGEGGSSRIHVELFLTRKDDNSTQDPNIFWVKVSDRFRPQQANATVTETISIREFPVIEYLNVLRQLRLVENFDASTVYRRLFLCDSGGYSIRFDRNSQLVIDICGPAPAGMGKVDRNMFNAQRLMNVLLRKTVRNPDTRYIRR